MWFYVIFQHIGSSFLQLNVYLNNVISSLKSTIVPLFEKVLSASDAGRIGRLVLPKACAEVSFQI